MFGSLSTFQVVQFGIGAASLIIITLTYLRMRRMRPDQIEAQLVRRLEGDFYHRDVLMVVTDVRVSSSDSVTDRFRNVYRRYPIGEVLVEVALEGPQVGEGNPWNDDVFRELCDEMGISPTYHEKPTESSRIGDVVVELRFTKTEPGEVTDFVRRIPEAVYGELEAAEGKPVV